MFKVMSIPAQPASLDIWDKKYRLKNQCGTHLEGEFDDTYLRIATALAAVEEDEDKWFPKFLWALRNGAIPAGRIVSNIGAEKYKPETSAINCTVSGTITDSMEDILAKVKEAGLTLKAGCGIGYEFSTLRPSGAFVKGSGATTSGPLSFMDIYDKMCFTISSAGGRRGAQMATFDVSHPDVLEFIKAKREDGRLRQFNLSLLITQDFVDAVKEDKDWDLGFPVMKSEEVDRDDIVTWKPFPLSTGYNKNGEGLVAFKVYKTVKARKIWDAIMSSTYDFAEPGFILIDQVNRMNNNWFCENIRATNPCGEQPLPPYGSCLLGSINLTAFVRDPFTPEASFDFDRYIEVVTIFTRMLDNVVELHGLPLSKQGEEIVNKRRHGMGFLGLGSALAMLGMKYGEPDSVDFTYEVSKNLALAGWRAGVELAKEKGPAPIMEKDFKITRHMVKIRPELEDEGFEVGDLVKGRILLARYSRYMQRLAKYSPELVEDVEKYGSRFTHHSSIAPTGTISLSLANNASNGIEPSFAHHYTRNVIREGKSTKEMMDVFSFEMLALRTLKGEDAALPESFVTSDDIAPEQHIDIQAAAQWWMDSSISKTINVPSDFPFEKFKDTYLYACAKGLKGCTTFRFNPEAFQGVLVKKEDLANTTYQFTLEDGSVVEYKGDEEIEYDGETHTAANLYDALKEGYYGKF